MRTSMYLLLKQNILLKTEKPYVYLCILYLRNYTFLQRGSESKYYIY